MLSKSRQDFHKVPAASMIAALFFLKFQDQAAFVVPAVRASAMRQTHLIALRAAGQGRGGNSMVGPPFVTSGFGRFSFRYTHLLTPDLGLIPQRQTLPADWGKTISWIRVIPVLLN